LISSEARFPSKVLVIESHLFLEESLDFGHRVFGEGLFPHQLNTFDSQEAADVLKP
jgi:hypothetical protein